MFPPASFFRALRAGECRSRAGHSANPAMSWHRPSLDRIHVLLVLAVISIIVHFVRRASKHAT